MKKNVDSLTQQDVSKNIGDDMGRDSPERIVLHYVMIVKTKTYKQTSVFKAIHIWERVVSIHKRKSHLALVNSVFGSAWCVALRVSFNYTIQYE